MSNKFMRSWHMTVFSHHYQWFWDNLSYTKGENFDGHMQKETFGKCVALLRLWKICEGWRPDESSGQWEGTDCVEFWEQLLLLSIEGESVSLDFLEC